MRQGLSHRCLDGLSHAGFSGVGGLGCFGGVGALGVPGGGLAGFGTPGAGMPGALPGAGVWSGSELGIEGLKHMFNPFFGRNRPVGADLVACDGPILPRRDLIPSTYQGGGKRSVGPPRRSARVGDLDAIRMRDTTSNRPAAASCTPDTPRLEGTARTDCSESILPDKPWFHLILSFLLRTYRRNLSIPDVNARRACGRCCRCACPPSPVTVRAHPV